MKLLIVDDHPLMREGFAAFLVQWRSDAVVLQAEDGAAALVLAEQHADLDIVLIDLILPGMDGLAVIAEFRRRRPKALVVVLSASEDPYRVRAALAAGARGYVAKTAPRQTLLAALQFVLDGHRYVPEFMVESDLSPPPEETRHRLTARQLEVLRHLAHGLSNKQIGARLGVAEKTVKVHVTDILQALGVVNRLQAVTAARSLGLL